MGSKEIRTIIIINKNKNNNNNNNDDDNHFEKMVTITAEKIRNHPIE